MPFYLPSALPDGACYYVRYRTDYPCGNAYYVFTLQMWQQNALTIKKR